MLPELKANLTTDSITFPSYDGFTAILKLDFKNCMLLNNIHTSLESVLMFRKIVQDTLFEQLDATDTRALNQFIVIQQESDRVLIRTNSNSKDDLRAIIVFTGKCFSKCLLKGFLSIASKPTA